MRTVRGREEIGPIAIGRREPPFPSGNGVAKEAATWNHDVIRFLLRQTKAVRTDFDPKNRFVGGGFIGWW